MKAFVTGGAGFIGAHVVRALVSRGDDVLVLHRPGEQLSNLDGLEVTLVAGDVRDRDLMRRAVRGRECVFHLAAIYSLHEPEVGLMRDVNVNGTRSVLDAALAEGVGKVVFTSSIAVFGGQGREHDADEQSPFRLGDTGDMYSLSKYESHAMAKRYATKGLDVTIVAPTGPIGPGDIGPTPTGRLLLNAARSPLLALVDSESCMIDVRDVARGHLLAGERGERGETYLLGARNMSLIELASIARDVLGYPAVRLPIPLGVAELASYVMLAHARRTHTPPLATPAAVRIARLGLRARCDKARRELGLEYGPIEPAVRDALAWFHDRGMLPAPSRTRMRLRGLGRGARLAAAG